MSVGSRVETSTPSSDRRWRSSSASVRTSSPAGTSNADRSTSSLKARHLDCRQRGALVDGDQAQEHPGDGVENELGDIGERDRPEPRTAPVRASVAAPSLHREPGSAGDHLGTAEFEVVAEEQARWLEGDLGRVSRPFRAVDPQSGLAGAKQDLGSGVADGSGPTGVLEAETSVAMQPDIGGRVESRRRGLAFDASDRQDPRHRSAAGHHALATVQIDRGCHRGRGTDELRVEDQFEKIAECAHAATLRQTRVRPPLIWTGAARLGRARPQGVGAGTTWKDPS